MKCNTAKDYNNSESLGWAYLAISKIPIISSFIDLIYSVVKEFTYSGGTTLWLNYNP